MKVVTEAKVTGKKVLLRADLDGPVKRLGRSHCGWESLDEAGLEATLPTIKFLRKEAARTIIIGHLDRPGGRVVGKLKLDPVAKKLDEHIKGIRKIDVCFGPKAEKAVEDLERGGFLLLENLRFYPGEEDNDSEFAKNLASLADLYVNDCFADSHRQHASIISIPKYLPSYAGLHFVKEVENLGKVLKNPVRPLLFIIGGAKVETKAPLVKKFAQVADVVLLGGLLMFERKLEGINNVHFPKDAVRVDDIGPKSIEEFCDFIKNARTIVWNGPMGRFEEEEFEKGTRAIAEAIAKSEARSIIGGGDTIVALDKFGLRDKMSFVSTGGGAMLEFLAEGTLPGIEALEDD